MKHRGMKIEDFMLEYPDTELFLMTPFGYVSILHSVNKESMQSHAGERGSEKKVDWEEVKEQIVITSYYNEKEKSWHLLTDYTL